jgi:hypothetical protein
LPSATAGRVQRCVTRLLDTSRTRLSLGRGRVEEKPELRPRGDGEWGVEGKPKRLQRNAELRWREVGAEGKPTLHGVMSSCGGARLEWRRRRSC